MPAGLLAGVFLPPVFLRGVDVADARPRERGVPVADLVAAAAEEVVRARFLGVGLAPPVVSSPEEVVVTAAGSASSSSEGRPRSRRSFFSHSVTFFLMLAHALVRLRVFVKPRRSAAVVVSMPLAWVFERRC